MVKKSEHIDVLWGEASSFFNVMSPAAWKMHSEGVEVAGMRGQILQRLREWDICPGYLSAKTKDCQSLVFEVQ